MLALTALPGCRFGDDLPVLARVGFSHGCACFGQDTEQWLCAQHVVSSEPVRSSWLIQMAPGLTSEDLC